MSSPLPPPLFARCTSVAAALALSLAACTPVTGRAARDAAPADADAPPVVDAADDGGPAALDVVVDDVEGCPRASGPSGVVSTAPFVSSSAAAFERFGAISARVDGRGRIWMFGQSVRCLRPEAMGELAVLRLLPDGTLDARFGEGGRACLSSPQAVGGSYGDVQDLAFHGERVVVAGSELAANGMATGVVAVLTDDGRPDPAFAQGGFFTFPNGVPWDFPVRYLSALSVSDEGVVVAGTDLNRFAIGTYGVLWRLDWSGRRDVTFGEAGRVVVPQVQSFSVLLPTPWGLLAAGSSRRSAPYLLALDRRGAPVPWFGRDGVAQRSLTRGLLVNGALADSRGGYVLAGSWGDVTRLDTLVAAAVRFDAAGGFDPTFGVGGVFVSPWLRHPSYLLARTLARQCDGRLLLGATDRGIVAKVHRLTPDGRLDVSFGVEGTATVDILPTWLSPTALFASPDDGAITLLGVTGNHMPPRRFTLSP